jgi:DNA helicase HerA-like ATPase
VLQAHDRLLVVGITGAGKSYWTKAHVVERSSRLFAWDPHGDYAQASVRTTLVGAAKALPQASRGNFRLSVVEPIGSAAFFDRFESWCDLAMTLERTTLLVEECVAIRSSTSARQKLTLLATQARHRGSPLVMVAQRAVHVHPDARSQISRLVAFRQTHPADVRALSEITGKNAEGVTMLPRHVPWVWSESDTWQK